MLLYASLFLAIIYRGAQSDSFLICFCCWLNSCQRLNQFILSTVASCYEIIFVVLLSIVFSFSHFSMKFEHSRTTRCRNKGSSTTIWMCQSVHNLLDINYWVILELQCLDSQAAFMLLNKLPFQYLHVINKTITVLSLFLLSLLFSF